MMKTLALCLAVMFIICGCSLRPPEQTPVNTPTQTPAQTAAVLAEERLSVVGFYFDTVITIIAYANDQGILEDALTRCEYYENLLSKTIEGSDVFRINHAGGEAVNVSEHTRTILETALEISELSNGKFDPTIAPVMELWDFTGGTAILPHEAELANAAALIDYTALTLDGASVTLKEGHMIDLGAVAKGYIADEIAAYLKQSGITSGILNFGGNVVVIGAKPDGEPWNVGLQDPKGQTGEYSSVVQAIDSSVVTSGIYERGFDIDGIRYHHILDTMTGMPVQNELASVTILSESSMTGDALSTACMALGRDEALALIEGMEGIEAVFITRDGDITATDGVRDNLKIVE